MEPSSTRSRFTIPIDSARPRGAARFEFFAPKIGRRVTLFTLLQVPLWTILESVPSVSAYCERPTFWEKASGRQLLTPGSRQDNTKRTGSSRPLPGLASPAP